VEAGERNGLVNNPEEQIRMRVDQLSSLFLCCSPQAMENLRKGGLEDSSHYISNLMEVSFCKNITKHWRPHLISLVDKSNIQVPQKFYLLTCHRQENANDSNLTEILAAMDAFAFPVLYPVHPRNKERVLRLVAEHSFRNIILTEPVGYFDSIHLINNAVTVVTDSGGVLQEAHYARKPYVFVLDIPQPPSDTRFDSSRLVRPKRDEILTKL
jgi:UDP-N-acetylglucosamine 2-epimerase (non-hydrolysing)/UDP-GlcNAc3NAcA epimerase